MNSMMSGLGREGATSEPGTSLIGGRWPGAGSLTLGALQGATTALSAMSQIGQGEATAKSLRMKAMDDMLGVGQAQVAGQAQIAGLRDKLANAFAGSVQAGGAGGVDVGQGIVQDTNRLVADRANAGEALVRGNTEMAATRARMNAIASMMKASEAEQAGKTNALGTALSGGLSLLKLFL